MRQCENTFTQNAKCKITYSHFIIPRLQHYYVTTSRECLNVMYKFRQSSVNLLDMLHCIHLCCIQRWTLSMINWRQLLVDLNLQRYQWSTTCVKILDKVPEWSTLIYGDTWSLFRVNITWWYQLSNINWSPTYSSLLLAYSHPMPVSQIHFTILVIYKFICMYVCGKHRQMNTACTVLAYHCTDKNSIKAR